jgi:hypothetical protein
MVPGPGSTSLVPVNCSALVRASINDELQPYGAGIGSLKDQEDKKARRRHLKRIREDLDTFVKYGLLQKTKGRFSLTPNGTLVMERLQTAAQAFIEMRDEYFYRNL